ncbi:D-Ala-D-Ala carboxypeptidase family metallohydrolase [Akkermansiaceae bacterium]|nr:D-Ala-D-Ala carboxypeptidase family metallohydrolase [Akkermansiaceae bacterium]
MSSDHSNLTNIESQQQDVLTPHTSSMQRRSFIGLVCLTSVAVLSGVNNAHAALFYSTRKVEGIPSSWVNEKGSDVLRYANYVKDLKLKNITPYMVLKPHFKKRGSISNTLPPRFMWKRIGNTLKVLDRLSSQINSPVKEILSMYRSPTYNRSCGGKSRSQHMENRALDVKFSRASSYTAARQVKRLRDSGYFKGGVGTYSSFLHIDTRGSNATW